MTMGDEMLQTLCTREILCSPKHVDEESFGSSDSEISNEFRVFRDYLGLINLIQPEGFCSPLDSPILPVSTSHIYDSMFDFSHLQKRNRLDSFDSDKGSEGSLGSRGEADLLLDSLSVNDGYSSYRPSIIGEPLLSQVNRKQDAFLARKNKMRKTGGEHAKNSQRQVCVFCRNNGESKEFYSSHTLKDIEGNTSCPILRAYTCPLCKANGDNSHTIKYCPKYTPKSKENKVLSV